MSFFRKASDNEVESSEPTNIEAFLANYSTEDLAQLVETWNQQFSQETPTFADHSNELLNNNQGQEKPEIELDVQPPVESTSKKTTKRNNQKKATTENSTEEHKRKTLNKPKGFKVANNELISLVDNRPLTAQEKNSVLPGGKKNHPEFKRDDKVFEAVPYSAWKEQYIWVHAVPSDGCMVYADPQEYANIKPTNSRVLDGVLRRSLYCYGEPPVFVIRIAAFRKLYNKYNQIKKNSNEQAKPVSIEQAPILSNATVSPDYNDQSTVQFEENFFAYSPISTPYMFIPIYPPEQPTIPQQHNVAPITYETNELTLPSSQNMHMANPATFFNNDNHRLPTDADYETAIQQVSQILNDPDNPKNKRKIRDDGTVVLSLDKNEEQVSNHRKAKK